MLDALQTAGIGPFPWRMSEEELSTVVTYLDGCFVKNTASQYKHGVTEQLSIVKREGLWPMCCHAPRDTLCAPHLLEYALRGFELAQNYFEEFPRLFSLECLWTQPAKKHGRDTHFWHKDGYDRKQFATFMYGTDVLEENDGAHLYVRTSHKVMHRPPRPFDENERYFNYETVLGPAGTCFFADPNGIHKGIRPNKLRMLVVARWGVSNPPASGYFWDKIEPVSCDLLGDRYPQDSQLQEAIRLIVA